VAHEVVDLILGVLSWVVLWEQAAKTAEEEEEDEKDKAKSNELAHDRSAVAVVSPRALALCHVFLELLTTELVVDKTTESDRVTEELERGDWVVKDGHRSHHEQNILEDTREGKDEGRGLADLEYVSELVMAAVGLF